MAVGRLDDSLRRDRNDLTINPADVFRTVNLRHAGDQPGRFGHVPRAPRMHNEPCIRKFRHHAARATGMIEMNMGQDDVVDSAVIQPKPAQCGERVWQGIVAAGVNECNPAVLDHQMNRRQNRPHIAGIEGNNSVAVISPVEHRYTR